MNDHGIRRLVGIPVVDLGLGRSIGEVKDLLITSSGVSRLHSVILESDGLFKDGRVLLFEDIFSFGKSSLTVVDQSVVRKPDQIDDKTQVISVESIIGLDVETTSGDLLGITEDLYINPFNGHITGIEISCGIINDVLNGRRKLEISEELHIDGSQVVVSDMTLNSIDSRTHSSRKES